MMQEILLNVDGMMCSHCENRVSTAVSELKGVTHVTVSLAEKTVSVTFDPSIVTDQQIRDAITEQGYEVK